MNNNPNDIESIGRSEMRIRVERSVLDAAANARERLLIHEKEHALYAGLIAKATALADDMKVINRPRVVSCSSTPADVQYSVATDLAIKQSPHTEAIIGFRRQIARAANSAATIATAEAQIDARNKQITRFNGSWISRLVGRRPPHANPLNADALKFITRQLDLQPEPFAAMLTGGDMELAAAEYKAQFDQDAELLAEWCERYEVIYAMARPVLYTNSADRLYTCFIFYRSILDGDPALGDQSMIDHEAGALFLPSSGHNIPMRNGRLKEWTYYVNRAGDGAVTRARLLPLLAGEE